MTYGEELKGIKIDLLSIILSNYLNIETSKIFKLLNNHEHRDFINWTGFLSVLENESSIREKLLDLKLYNLKTLKFVHF